MNKKIQNSKFEIYQIKNKFLSKKKIPLISVITVVKDADKYLEKTLLNIFSQDYPKVELIVVYTPSGDSTWDIIMKYKSKIDKIIINYHTGIYQAFNTGVVNARGDWINFMNSGDYFYNKKIISEIFTNYSYRSYDVIYGDVLIKYNNFNRVEKSTNILQIIRKMPFSHQSCFIRASVQKKNLFISSFRFSADYFLFYKLFIRKHKFIKLESILSICRAQGLCDLNRNFTLYENLKINRSFKQNYFYYDYFFYFFQLSRFKIVKFLEKFMSNNQISSLKKNYYRFFK